ncbi:hypothetical protein ACTXOR_11640 [Arthrobacter rhombi]|uniref:Uncharacterized protein n=1 Tax=Arthrobacter rhombi TaxID=71253 RepID=A0A1R4FRT1_9MICC|nr:hypothetical protein [Arthrobacter rhombi]SJM58527.1 hypothetical protein FM101_05370 [Arthrobacter rhombi]
MDHDEPSTARPADSAPLLGGNPSAPGLRESYDPQAGPRNPWPAIIGMITTLSVIVIVLFMVL